LHDVKNYRPISILPSLFKVFEKLIHKHLYSYFETNNLLYNHNSRFRKYHSTTSNILEVTHTLLVAKDSGCSSRVVFLDISKAFDKVFHSALLFKLRQLGVSGSVYNLLKSYLSGRSQFVRLGDFRSDHLHTNCGTPQGSVLGPLLFLVYVNDIGTNIKSSVSLFADDTILLCPSKNPRTLHTMLSNDLCQLEMWSDLWSVTFNAAKTEALTITNNPSLHPPLRFCNQALNETTSHKHQGLIFHRSLTWHLHISTLHHRAMSIVHALKKIKNFLPRYSLLVLYRAYVLPIVDYGDIIFDNCTTTNSNLLEGVQTAAAKIILGCLKTTSHEIILKDLGLTSLFIRRQLHILKAFRAILFGPCPSFLSTLAPKFFKNLSNYSSRFHTNVQLSSCETHSLHNSFFHKGTKLWNSLHTYLHNLSSRQFCFKVSDLFLTKKTNAWHLHGCNTNATAILCMLRLGHSKLNIDGRYN